MAIDNQFGKGIGLAAGFDLGAQKPLDSRIAVNTIVERDAHVDENRAYEGMIVFVDETKKNYQLLNGVWVELFKDEQDRLASLEAELRGEGEGSEGGALATLQANINTVQDNLDDEKERAEQVEAGLQDAIDAINNAENGILAQAKALDKTDRDAQLLVDQEQDRRLKALEDANAEGGAVKEAIDQVQANLDAFEAEQATKEAAQDAEDVRLDQAIKDEAAAARAAEKANADEMIKQKDAAQEGTLANQIKVEREAREATDTALDGRVQAIEKSIGNGGDLEKRVKANEDAIDVINGDGEGSIKKAVADLVNGAPEALDTLDELATALRDNKDVLTAIENTFDGKLATLQADVDQNEADCDAAIANEKQRAEGQEAAIRGEFAAADTKLKSDLQAEIDADVKVEKERAEAAEKAINDEIANMKNADLDGSLANLIADEAARADAAEKANASAIASNTSNIANNKSVLDKLDGSVTTEGSIKKQIKDAVDGITTGDGSIGARLTTVESKNIEQDAAIAKNASDITGEISRAKAAEEANASAIASNTSNIANNRSVLDKLDGSVTTEGSIKKQIKDAVDGITTGNGSIGARLTAVETKNSEQDTAIAKNASDLNSHASDKEIHITETERTAWNAKSEFDGNYNSLTNKPTIPSKTSELTNDSGYMTDVDLQPVIKHASSDHAPSNAQKNSDITKEEIEAKLVGDIATHTHSQYLTSHQDISGKADKSDLTAHTSNNDIHVTKTQKDAWDAKETTSGAQSKADAALQSAKTYADAQDTALHTTISSEIDSNVAAEATLRSNADTALSNRIANFEAGGANDISTLETNLKAYADQAEADAIKTAGEALATGLAGKANKEHGNHVPETQSVNNKVFLRNDNTWAEVKPENIGAAPSNHGTHVTYATITPLAPGVAAIGISGKVAREDHVHPLQTDVTGNAGTANKLAAARTITVKGDASGSVSFDGSADRDLNLTLSNSGVTVGTYGPTGDTAPNYKETFKVPQVTVDAKGRITSVVDRTITLPEHKDTVINEATGSSAGLMSAADKAKLDKIADEANKYVHPVTHDASIITQDETHRFVSDTEKADWNAKETTSGAQSKANTAAANALKDAKDYADQQITALVNGAPEAMNTLNELAQAISDHQDVYEELLTNVGNKAEKSYVDTELAKKVDKVTGSRLISETEAAGYAAKAEVSQVNQALADAKTYTNEEIAKITSGDGSIGTRLTAVETKNSEQDTAIAENASDITEEISRAKAAEEANASAIASNTSNIANNRSVLDKLDGSITTEGSVKKQIKDAVDGITTGDGSIGARLTAVESKNIEQDASITTAQSTANQAAADIATEKARAEAAEKINSDAIGVLNGDITVAGSVDKKIADNNVFNTDILTVNALGGISAGTDLNGLTVEEVLKKLLYPYVEPTISATGTPNGGTYESGNNQTITNVKVVVGKKSEQITKVEVFNGATSLGSKQGNEVSNGGTFNFAVSVSVNSTNVQLTAKATDASGKIVSANTGKFNFVYPYYWGVCTDGAEINEAMVKGLTKKVEGKASKSVTYTTDFQRAVFAYPASYGDIKKILDPNSFDVTNTFTKHSVDIVGLDGEEVAYNVYVNNAFTATGFKFTFSY